MTCRNALPLCLLAFALGAATLPAMASDDCDVPVEHWRPRDAVRAMARQRGWQIERLKIDDGCYELRGIDAEGRRFKARIDPETLRPVKLKPGEREHGRERRQGESALEGGAGPHSTPGRVRRGRSD